MPHVSRDYPPQDGDHDRVANDQLLHRLSHAEPAVPRDRDQYSDDAVLTVLPQPRDRHLSGDCGDGAAIAQGATASITAREGLRLDHLDGLPARERAGDGLMSTRRPAHLDGGRLIRLAQAEIERQVTLGQVAGLSVHDLEDAPALGQDYRDLGAQPLAVRARAAEADLEEVDAVPLRQVAHQHLRRG